jgi:predicted dehydrogenase/threonine dehydrogenase-like Zn-dependent dehydrogenase
MKQVIQSLSSGKLEIADVPVPQVAPGGVLVRTRASLVSAGTERMVASFAQSNLLEKARSRPDLVRQTIEKAKRDGVLDTIDAVRNRLDQPMPLGYSAAGDVIAVGAEVSDIRAGDRVACAGAGIAVHAQVIAVPRNLAVVIPEGVSYEQAAFSTLGAIALHGVHLANAQLGETVAVIGLGLLGLLSVQLLRAAGCAVVGIDPNAQRADLATALGARWAGSDPAEFAARVALASGGHGADAVLITADTPSDQPVALAGDVARKRGTVVAVGNVGTHLPRKTYFEKELDFRISRSYGPGRYDAAYEQDGHDYPYEYVRWTENRNLQAFSSMVAGGAVNADALITHRFEIEEAGKAYDLVLGKDGEPFLGVVLRYTSEPDLAPRIRPVPLAARGERVAPEAPGEGRTLPKSVDVGVLGAGLFANATLLPAMKATAGVRLVAVGSGAGVSARAAAGRFGFDYCTSGADELLRDERINTIAILTRHSLHAAQAEATLRAGKNVYVEKPLCLTAEELDGIVAAYGAQPKRPLLMAGYNRRFAPMVVALREALRRASEPLLLSIRVNAGYIAPEHWTQDPREGGRLRGEGCHFIDLLIDLAGDRVRRVTTRALPDGGRYRQDNFTVTLEFANGSVGTLVYAANGAKAFGKESIEAFGGGLSARLDDYRALVIQQGTRAKRMHSRLRQDKGHRGEWQAIVRHLTAGGPPPIAFDEIVHSTRATLAAYESLRTGEPVEVPAT